MKYKLIACDMDGTLLNDDRVLTKKTIETIKKVINKGCIFTVCTGRSLAGVYSFPFLLELPAPLILYNGAVILDTRTDKFIYKKELENDDCKKIIDIGKSFNTTVCIWSENQLYSNKINESTKFFTKFSCKEPILIKDFNEIYDKGITKIVFIDSEEKISKMHDDIASKNSFNKVSFCTSQTMFLEFFNSEISKGKTLETLCRKLKILPNEVIAIGDGNNDISMIEYAGLGIGVENARESLKEKAQYITSSNNDEGVSKALEKFVLKED